MFDEHKFHPHLTKILDEFVICLEAFSCLDRKPAPATIKQFLSVLHSLRQSQPIDIEFMHMKKMWDQTSQSDDAKDNTKLVSNFFRLLAQSDAGAKT